MIWIMCVDLLFTSGFTYPSQSLSLWGNVVCLEGRGSHEYMMKTKVFGFVLLFPRYDLD